MKLSRRSSFLLAGLLASAATGTVVQSLATAEATNRARTALSQISGLTAGSVSVNPWTGKVSVADLSVQRKGLRVHVGAVAFRSKGALLPSFIAPAFADDEPVKLENLVIDLDTAKITIPSIEATGTELSADELKAIIDPKSDLTPKARVDKLTASSISAPEVHVDIKIGKVTETVVYKDIGLKEVEKGRIGEMTAASGVVKAVSDDSKVPIDATFGTMTAKEVDLGLYVELFTGNRKNADEDVRPLYDSVTLGGMEMTAGDKFKLSIGAINSGAVSARPLLKSISDLQKELPTGTKSDLSPEQAKTLIAFFADFYSSFEIGKAEIVDLVGTSLDPKDKGGFKIRRMGIANIADSAIGEISLDGLDIDAQDAHVALGNFAFRGFNFKEPLAALVKASAEGGPDFMKTINPRLLIPTFDQITVAGVDVNAPAPGHDGNAAGGDRNAFKLGSADYRNGNFLLGVPTKIALTIEHLAAGLPLKDPQVAPMIQLGYSALDLSAKTEAAWDEASKQVTVNELSVSAVGVGSINVKTTFGNVPKDLFTGDMALVQASVLGVLWKELDVRIENAGIVDKFFVFQADQQKQTVDQLRQTGIKGVTENLPKLLGNSPAVQELVGAIVSFIENPKSLEVDAKSDAGLGIADAPLMNNPPDLLTKIKLKAIANQ